MDNLRIGDKVGLSWIQGHGNAKVVGIYQDYVIVIHSYCFAQRPHVLHKSDIVPPEPEKEEAVIPYTHYCGYVVDGHCVSWRYCPGCEIPHKEETEPPLTIEQIMKTICDDIQKGGPIRQAIKSI